MHENTPAAYAVHDRFSDPGPYAELLRTLPDGRAELLSALNGVLIHVWKVQKFHPEWLERRPHDVWTRRAENVLARIAELGPEPLSEPRPEERRAIVDCRTFALLACAALRERGVPARPRCGFASYLEDSHWQDHWLCEWWDGSGKGRWVMDDADIQKPDVSPDEFVSSCRAWQRGRADAESVKDFGFGPGMCGLSPVRLDLTHDFAALNGFVGVSGDGWGLGNKPEADLAPGDLALLDHAAALGCDDSRPEERRAFYEAAPGLLAPPQSIVHYDYLQAMRESTVAWEREP